MSVVGYINVSLEIWGGILSFIIAVCLLLDGQSPTLQKRLFFRLVVCNAVILLSDGAAWLFKGNQNLVCWWGVRISNFLTFFCGYILLTLFTHYLTVYLSERTQVSRRPLWAIRVMCGIALFMVVLTQFNHMLYSIDAQNVYHRQDWFWLSQVGGILGMCVNAGLLIRYRQVIGTREKAALWSYLVLPVLAMSVQIFVYGVALLNLADTLAILMVFLFLQVEQSRKRKERELELTHLRISTMLQQIQPHFLYNSLTAIAQLCRTDPQKAEKATIAFANYLRANMESLTVEGPIPFEAELRHVKTYLFLEKIRFADELKVVYEVGTADFFLPALTVQPLVENAVKHGVGKKETGGTVSICTMETQTEYQIVIADDGVGFKPADMEEDGRTHIGIDNVTARLKTMVHGSLEIESQPGVGTKVVIKIPKGGEELEDPFSG